MLRTRLSGWVVLIVAAHAATATASPLRLISTQHLDSRLEQLTFTTPALAQPTSIRVLLPAGYATQPHRRYPVLYLLHGAQDDFTSWTVKGDAERLTARDRLIVVMPDSGTTGGYVNWYNGGAGGPPEWETYHIDQLIPWVDAHLRTVARRAGRAVAGLSMGGFGAMSYAARHPDLFAAVASFSGALDTNNPLDIAVTGNNVFGPRLTQQVRWRAHNPWDLAVNLRGVNITIRTGNGLPGGPFGGGDIFEVAVHLMSVSFHNRLVALGIPSIWDDYGPGGHTWPYWQRDLRETLPTLRSVFAHPNPPPAVFTFTAVEPSYVAYGWRVTVRRPALEFSTLRVQGRRAFELTGSGTATVITAALYARHQLEATTVTDATGTHERRLTPDRAGRLHIALNLGPVNRAQQYTLGEAAHDRHSLIARVTVRAPR